MATKLVLIDGAALKPSPAAAVVLTTPAVKHSPGATIRPLAKVESPVAPPVAPRTKSPVSLSLKQRVLAFVGKHKKAIAICAAATALGPMAGGIVDWLTPPRSPKTARRVVEPVRTEPTPPAPPPVKPIETKKETPPVTPKKAPASRPEPRRVSQAQPGRGPNSNPKDAGEHVAAKSVPPSLIEMAEKLYLEAYEQRGYDPEAAAAKFERIVRLVPPGFEVHEKAKRRLEEIERGR